MTNALRSAVLMTTLVLLSAGVAQAQATGTMDVSANIVRGLLVTNTTDLAFGMLMAGTGGTVTILADGTYTSTGGIVPVTAPTSPAAFYVTDLDAKGGRKFTFTVLDASILLTRGGGTETMTVNAFTNNAIPCQPCSKTPATIQVGGTLTVGSSQAPGTYVGTFNVRVDQP